MGGGGGGGGGWINYLLGGLLLPPILDFAGVDNVSLTMHVFSTAEACLDFSSCTCVSAGGFLGSDASVTVLLDLTPEADLHLPGFKTFPSTQHSWTYEKAFRGVRLSGLRATVSTLTSLQRQVSSLRWNILCICHVLTIL